MHVHMSDAATVSMTRVPMAATGFEAMVGAIGDTHHRHIRNIVVFLTRDRRRGFGGRGAAARGRRRTATRMLMSPQ